VAGQPRYQLFHLKQDPLETHNLADKNPEQLKIMMKVLSEEINNKKALYPENKNQKLKLIMPK
jgi:hypothetical protein